MSASRKAVACEPFERATDKTDIKKKAARPVPLSIRVSDAEREDLQVAAKGDSLNAYIRSRIFDDKGRARASRRRQPVKDHAALAWALALLGALDLGHSLRELSNAALTGALDVDAETKAELRAACAAVLAIKSDLMRALGFNDGGAPP